MSEAHLKSFQRIVFCFGRAPILCLRHTPCRVWLPLGDGGTPGQAVHDGGGKARGAVEVGKGGGSGALAGEAGGEGPRGGRGELQLRDRRLGGAGGGNLDKVAFSFDFSGRELEHPFAPGLPPSTMYK